MRKIIVFSHLRWRFVYQRPQHLLSRLAKYYSIIFIEEPIFDAQGSFFEVEEVSKNIQVYRPHTPSSAPGFHDDQLRYLQTLLGELLKRERDYIVWFYTPMALPLLQELKPGLLVYDCMDELSAFKNAPRQLTQRENALLKIVDIVLTGGPSLYQAKCKRHRNVYCFPSSVDSAHFARAVNHSDSHALQKNISRPRLGFFGVIDERFDTELIATIAKARPNWQIVLVGPVVKIDPNTLPRTHNIHYLGQQPYEDLPQLLSGWDVCLLPFALNEATRFISPTKTLEYMAGGRPIVSTAIADIIELYGDVVSIAHDSSSFIALCEEALTLTPQQEARQRNAMKAKVATTSWDATAAKIRELLDTALALVNSQPNVPISQEKPQFLFMGKLREKRLIYG